MRWLFAAMPPRIKNMRHCAIKSQQYTTHDNIVDQNNVTVFHTQEPHWPETARHTPTTCGLVHVIFGHPHIPLISPFLVSISPVVSERSELLKCSIGSTSQMTFFLAREHSLLEVCNLSNYDLSKIQFSFESRSEEYGGTLIP